ncbi:zinc finger B-box domain-containing protein 1 isoform X3 [Oryzias latipes]|uniref:zinc finger B-box domain-containing protein 1 isoform X3 n=1 Tax=Oryzias latipes TaxID=8090 RepID=UPI0009D9B9B6|nr:zinc finger B-box domain-containing protein 1 isoform X3 [Oryzias latipes]
MQKLKLTVESLENDSKEMEERLQQLKEHMSKEKEERGLSRGFKWASGQHIPFNSNYPANKKKNENVIYKSQQQTGKVRIRVLKRESFTDLLQPPPPRSVGQLTVRRNRVKETICGPCEVKTAGLVLMVSDEEEKDMEVIETAVRRQPSCLLDGNFSEEESARYFQEALKQWRRERRDGKVQPMDATLTLQSAMATQVDLLPDRKAEKRRGGEEETPTVSVQFTQNKLTYMDRLLLKKHRRTPTENPTPLLNDETKLKLLPDEDPEEDAVCTFTAEEEDLHIYFASLFAPPDSSSRTKPQIVAPEPCFVIQILDETNIDTTRECVQEQKTDNRMVSLVHQISETSLKSSDSESAQSSSTKQPFKAVTPTQHKTGRKLNPTQLQDVAFEYSKSHISEDRLLPLTPGSFPLRSTFTVSPPSSTESALLPNIFFPSPQTKSESYVFQELASPTKLLEAPRDKLMSPRHVKQFKSGPENQLLEDQLTHVPCMPAGIDPTPTTLEPVRSITGPVPCPLHKQYFPKSIPRYGESPLCTSSTHISDDLKTNQSSQNTDFIASPLLNIGANTVKMEEELEPSADSGDELSSDSLSLALFEEDSSGVETQIQGHLTTKKLKEKQSSASCFQEDSFIPAEPEKEKDLLTDKPERLMASFHSPFSSVPPSVSMSPQVMQSQSVGTGSQHFCDLNGFSPLGLDVDTCYTHSPEQPFCSRQSSLHDLNPTVSVTDVFNKSAPVPSGTVITTSRPPSVPTHSFSQAAKEIMEISNMDLTGCEDPDVDADTVARILQSLEQELEATTKGTYSLLLDIGNSGGQNQDSKPCFVWGGVSEEEKKNEEAANRDRESVFLLP